MGDALKNLRSGLIVTRTPLRISFAGGGTDLPNFYEHQPGAVLSTTINKYVYVTIKRHGDLFTFLSDGGVTIEPHRMPDGGQTRLFGHLMMFWTNIQRDANSVLREQKNNTVSKMGHLSQMRDHAEKLRTMIMNRDFNVVEF